jgi:hypothetical protein
MGGMTGWMDDGMGGWVDERDENGWMVGGERG